MVASASFGDFPELAAIKDYGKTGNAVGAAFFRDRRLLRFSQNNLGIQDLLRSKTGDHMTFAEQIIATLIGTFGGFVGSLILFWLKETYQLKTKEKSLIKNLLYELEYNKNLLTRYEKNLTLCIEALGANNKNTYCDIQYEKIAHFFSRQFYKEGLVTKYLHPEDVSRWNDFLASLSDGAEAHLNETLSKWREGSTTTEETFRVLNHERSHIKYAIDMSEYLAGKIK